MVNYSYYARCVLVSYDLQITYKRQLGGEVRISRPSPNQNYSTQPVFIMPSVPVGRMSPPSPTSPMTSRRKSTIPAGFRAAPRPKPRPIAEMSVRELRDLHALNMKILSTPWVFLNSKATFVELTIHLLLCILGEHLLPPM